MHHGLYDSAGSPAICDHVDEGITLGKLSQTQKMYMHNFAPLWNLKLKSRVGQLLPVAGGGGR